MDYQKPNKRPRILLEDNHIYLIGDWNKQNVSALKRKASKMFLPSVPQVVVDGKEMRSLDSAGALVLFKLIERLEKKDLSISWVGFTSDHLTLLELVSEKKDALEDLPSIQSQETFLSAIGKATTNKVNQFLTYMEFFGQFLVMSFHSVRHFTSLQWRSFVNSIYQMGYSALPIIALLSFLVGVVIAYQLGIQLQNYGANAFMATLVGNAVLREFGPLITAIIGAGRTSAALTAQLGAMKINQEIDVLQTMGFSPFDILVIPRVIASLVVFPLLIIWADIFGIMGGMIVTKALYGTLYGDFLSRMDEVITLSTLFVGLSKAPAFALIISLVGCFQGFHVSNKADSIGTQTTKSVVQAIFLIIIADAVYSIIYSRFNI